MMRRSIYLILMISALTFFLGCRETFQQIGVFSIRDLQGGCREITDGIGRKLLLVPQGCKAPNGYEKADIVRIPVKRVVVYSPYNAALIKAIGHADSIGGVVIKKEDWRIPEIRNGIERGKVLYLGQYTSVDYERLKALKPDVVFTWDEGIVPKLTELSIPCVVTTTKVAKDLEAHINFIRFISVFYGEEQKAKAFAESQFERIKEISSRLDHAGEGPKVIWADIHAREVMVEPGNSWAAEIAGKAGGDYLFSDLEGASCMQVTIEKFFSRAKNADILTTYRGPESGITSKEALEKSSRLLQTVNIRPMNEGKIYFTGWRLYQSADTAGIVEELAGIFHPEIFGRVENPEYFFELPDR